jgi:hypothetical protein
MQLHRFPISSDGSAGALIRKFGACSVFYAHDGRNAWHSTWVQRYFEGCIHTSLESAKEYCEQRRKSGSVFYLVQLPSLCFAIDSGIYVLVQINTKNPFEHYRALCRFQSDTDPQNDARMLFSQGSRASDAIQSFAPESAHWIKPPNHDSLILNWRSNSGTPAGDYSALEPLTAEPLYKYKSSSRGPSYYLEWSKSINSIRKQGALDVLRDTGYLAPVVPIRAPSLRPTK